MVRNDTLIPDEDIDVPGRDAMNEIDDRSNPRMYRDIDFLNTENISEEEARDILYDSE